MATINNPFSDPFSFTADAADWYDPLLSVATAVATSHNVNDALDRLAQKFSQLLSITHCYIRTWQPENGQALVVAAASYAVAPTFPPSLYQKIEKEHRKFPSKPPLLLHAADEALPDAERSYLAQYGGKSVLILPLKAHQQLVGFVELWETRTHRDFSQSELAQCVLIGQQTAVALLYHQLQEKEFRARRESETLFDIAKYLSETLDLAEIFERTLTIVRRYLGPISNCSIAILSEDGRALQTQAQWSENLEYTITHIGETVPLDDLTLSKLALRNRHPIAIDNTDEISLLNLRILSLREKGLRSALYVPLLTRGKPTGLLNIHIWHNSRHFTAQEVSLCQNIAYHAAMAIENTLFHARQNRQLKLAALLQRMGNLLTTRFTVEQLYQQLFDCLAEIVPYDFAYLQLQDKHTALKPIVASRGLLPREQQQIYEELYADLQRDPLLHGPGWAFIELASLKTAVPPLAEAQSWLVAALKIKDQLIGVLNLVSRQPHAYDAEAAQAVVALANQTAVALANGRLHQQVVEQADEMAILHQISATTPLDFDLDTLLTRTTHMLARRLYSPLFGFVMYQKESGHLRPHPAFHGADEAWLAQPIPADSFVGHVIRVGQAQIVADVAHAPTAAHLCTQAAQSAIGVPLIVGDEVIGALLAESPQLHTFSNKDLYFLTTLARQLAVVIERAQSYQTLLAQKEWLKGEVGERAAELQAEQDRTITILESAGEGIVLTDANWLVLYVNRAMELMSGYGRDQLLGQPLHRLIDGSSQLQLAQSSVDGRGYWSNELLSQRQDGSTYNVRLTVTPIADRINQTNGYIVMQSDISRLKEVERLKVEFTSNVTHDLRTPLTNIKTYVSLLQRGKAENHGRYFAVLHQEIDRLNQLIQALLDISRLDVELVPDTQTRTDLGALLQELQQTFAPLAQRHHIQQTLHLPTAAGPVLLMAKPHLRKLLENIIDNAIKYSLPNTEVAVQVQNDGRFVQITVTDHGIGIPLAEQPHLFERFFRGETARQAHIAGMGLGLTMVQKIVTRYGGSIDLYSQPATGTRFCVRLPLPEELGP